MAKIVENIKGPFYSNCTVEAIKAKIRHPLKTKITIVKRSEAGCPHFLWSDGESDYDFGVEKHLVGFEKLWFSGYIRKRNLGFNAKYKKTMDERWLKRKAKSCQIKIDKSEST